MFIDHFGLVIVVQSYQWIDRPRYLAAVKNSFSTGDICAVIRMIAIFNAGI